MVRFPLVLDLLVLLERGLGGAGVVTFVTGMSDTVVLVLDVVGHGLGDTRNIFSNGTGNNCSSPPFHLYDKYACNGVIY